MRIIAGEARGRTLYAPPGDQTRPTSDKLRGSLFNIIGTAVQGARVLDLFGGTGALALEALSRGARRAVIVDSARAAIQAIERNAHAVFNRADEAEFADRVRILRADYRSAIARLAPFLADLPAGASIADVIRPEAGAIRFEADAIRPEAGATGPEAQGAKAVAPDACAFDLVFLDPPYRMIDAYADALARLMDAGLLAEGCLVVLERRADARVPLPEGFAAVDSRVYGETAVDFVRRADSLRE